MTLNAGMYPEFVIRHSNHSLEGIIDSQLQLTF
jgi:hypothetical protein